MEDRASASHCLASVERSSAASSSFAGNAFEEKYIEDESAICDAWRAKHSPHQEARIPEDLVPEDALKTTKILVVIGDTCWLYTHIQEKQAWA